MLDDAATCRILIEHLHHIRVIELNLPPTYSYTPDALPGASSLAAVFRCAAPVLETIRIRDGNYCYSRERIDLPVLRVQTLHNIDPQGFRLSHLAGCGGSATLRTLIISTLSDEAGLSAHDWAILCSFPALEALAVKIRSPRAVDSLTEQRRFPATLRRLHLEMDWNTMHNLLWSNNLALLTSWHISMWDDDQSVSLVDLWPFLGEDLVSASVSICGASTTFTATSQTGQEIIVRGVQYHESCWALFSRVRTLCLAGFGGPAAIRAPSLATFPVLRDLTLDVTSMRSMWHHDDPNDLTLPPQLRLVCPVLHSLHIASSGDVGSLRLDDVVSFLRNRLDTGSRKLPALFFHRIAVCAVQDVDVDAVLREFAETISSTMTHELWPGCDQPWRKHWDDCSFRDLTF
ncbi:hypothetical protein AURDEDRAFT_187702 [Auricularia subglabra TFB-10046 SS5]|nr:hypothetical protein AURDEDRAFT_187702 [Auricularia subglabra TFB-10046 SS5]